MSGIIGTEWLNSNSLRNYPVAQSATCVATDSSFRLPDDFLVDLKLAVPFVQNIKSYNFYISSITVYPSGCVFEVSYGDRFTSSVAVSAPIAFDSFEPYTAVELKGVQSRSNFDFSQSAGWAIIGSVDKIKDQAGKIKFTPEATRLEPSTISLGPRRISGIRVLNSGLTTPVISGQVLFESGSNHSIAVDGNTLKFNALDGGGLQAECECNDVELSPCIRTVNGIHGDPVGNLVISGGDCINVSSSSGDGLLIEDTCAKPCCGCTELQVVATDTSNISLQINALIAQIAALSSVVNALQNTCLGSSTDPTTCAQDGN